jgi:hypothetical protein
MAYRRGEHAALADCVASRVGECGTDEARILASLQPSRPDGLTLADLGQHAPSVVSPRPSRPARVADTCVPSTVRRPSRLADFPFDVRFFRHPHFLAQV